MDPPLVFDGHNDTVLTLPEEKRKMRSAFIEGHGEGHMDLPKIREGTFGGGFFAVFIGPCPETKSRDQRRSKTTGGQRLEPPPPLRPEYACQEADEMLTRLEQLVELAGDRMQIATTTEDLRANNQTETVSVVLHFEGAEPISPDLQNLEAYYSRGLRSIGLVWSRENAFGHGVPFEFPGHPDTGAELKPAGKKLVEKCNELGIVVDLAHLNERGFWDVANRSEDPLVVSHAGVHEICPSTRNLTDEQLKAVADSGGVVGITFAASALRRNGDRSTEADIDILVDHIEYVIEEVGVDHVALGSDFDGAAVIDGVGDVSGLPAIFTALQARGYDEIACQKIARENWLRVLDQIW